MAWFSIGFELGRALLMSAAIAAAVAAGAMRVRRPAGLAILLTAAVAALWPLATVGHSAWDLDHDLGVNSLFLHVLTACAWAGGIIGLVLIRYRSPGSLPVAAHPFCPVAGACFLGVAASGILAALLKVSTPAELVSSYGTLLIGKAVILLLLGGAGLWHRRQMLTRLRATGSAAFAWLLAGEVVLLCSAIALGVALGRTDPPGGAPAVLTSAQALLGYDLPPELTASRWFTTWRTDTLLVPIAIGAVWIYLREVARVRKRGGSWSPIRTLAWIGGWALLTWATSGAPGVYGRVLFSAFVVQHTTIAIATPALLVLGAPRDLLLHSTAPRRDRTHGAREWMHTLTQLSWARRLAHPVAAGVLYVGSLTAYYSTGLLEPSLRSHTAHVATTLYFLATGCALATAILKTSQRSSGALATHLLPTVFDAHAAAFVGLSMQTSVLAATWFEGLDRTWGANPHQDQRRLGLLLGLILGSLVLLLVAMQLRPGRRRERVKVFSTLKQ